ncbi:MAG: hypothetical protein EOO00_06795 [Chitinophagaceae bacterium]|nr:MAG: hypothetical protein EOO00_06795 [Chitinophagaceae bacterium]
MTASFSFPRLFQLIRKQWVENTRLYIYSVLALLGMLGLVTILWVISDSNSYSEDSLYIIFIFGLFIAGTVFAATSFSMLGSKEKGTYWLSFPASHLEKLICMIFYNVILFTIVYCLCFLLVRALGVAYVSSLVDKYPGIYTFRRSSWDPQHSFLGVVPYLLYVFFAVQSFYLLGSVYFSRYAFIVTTIAGSVLIFLFFFSSVNLIEESLDGYSFAGDHLRKYTDDMNYQRYDLSPVMRESILFFGKYIWAPVFWVVAWFRLKEKQI